MKHDKQYWIDKLESAKKNQKLWSFEIDGIKWKLGLKASRIPFHYRWAAFGKLTKLRRKLHTLETTKIPYYEAMIRHYPNTRVAHNTYDPL